VILSADMANKYKDKIKLAEIHKALLLHFIVLQSLILFWLIFIKDFQSIEKQ
jgi:hypothetical protein